MKVRKREVIFVLVLAAVLLLWALWPKQQGQRVSVTVDGEAAGSYALTQDRQIPLEGHGGYSLTLVIQNGKAHVEDSSCPDLICQNHAPISRDSEQIVCLPARIVITVTGGEEEGFDAIAQ